MGRATITVVEDDLLAGAHVPAQLAEDLACAIARVDAADVTAAVAASSALLISSTRSVRGRLARAHPACRPRSFTVLEAAWLGDHVRTSVAGGAIPAGAPPMPAAATDRFAWWVAELDAARGVARPPVQGKSLSSKHSQAWQDLVSSGDATAAMKRLAESWVAVRDLDPA